MDKPMFTENQLKKLILRMSQTKDELLADNNYAEATGRFNYVDNGSNILAIAHVDYVIWNKPKILQTKDGLICTGGQVDDRVGVWILLDVLSHLGYDILLTDNEEIGQSTAEDFCQFDNYKQYDWCFSFDRRGTDAVEYDTGDESWKSAIKKHFELGIGSFSDISFTDDLCGAGVNVGCGYHGEHTKNAYVSLTQCFNQVKRFISFFEEFSTTRFDRVQATSFSFTQV